MGERIMKPLRNQQRWWALAIALTCGLLAALPVGATVTGLVQIPTAATVGAGTYVVEPLYFTGTEDDIVSGFVIGTEFGFGHRTEMGLDLDLSSGTFAHATDRVTLDMKYRLSSARSENGLALGVYDVVTGATPIPYLAYSRERNNWYGTFGVQYDDGTLVWFTGLSHLLNEQLEIEIDYINDADAALGVGVTYALTPRYSINLAALFPNDSAQRVGYEFSIDLAGTLRHAVPLPPAPAKPSASFTR